MIETWLVELETHDRTKIMIVINRLSRTIVTASLSAQVLINPMPCPITSISGERRLIQEGKQQGSRPAGKPVLRELAEQ